MPDLQFPLIFIFATFIIIFTIHDILATVLSHSGAGFITQFWTSRVWKVILWTRYQLNIKFFIKHAGPFFLVAIIAMWYLFFNIAWFLLLYNGGYTVKGGSGEAPGAWEVLYYLGSTFTTLGIGDYVPTGFPWTLVTTSGALVVTLLTSISISYLIPVISAVVDRRKMVSAIDIIGDSPDKILQAAWSDKNSGALDSEVLSASDSLLKESYRSHVYPVLGFFYFEESHSSLNEAVLNLFDALMVQKLNPEREGNIVPTRLTYLLNAIDIYISNLFELSNISNLQVGHQDFIALLNRQGTDLKSLDEKQMEETLEKRRILLTLAYLEGRCPLDQDGKLRRHGYSTDVAF